MNRNLSRILLAGGIVAVTPIVVGALCIGTLRAEDDHFVQTNLVSDLSGLAAVTDTALKNPWGLAHSPTSPFWSSNQVTNTATIYAVTNKTTVAKVALTVAIPTTGSGPQGPTGQVNNTNGSSFPVNNGGDGGSAHFIFANLNGTISAWDKGTTAFIQVTTLGAVYTGLAVNGGQTRLYAANAAGAGSIDVFDSSFAPVNLGSGAFVNLELPAGLVPFNVQNISGDIYVAYAPAGRINEINAPLGAGAVAIFDEDGSFIKQLVVGSRLAAPWGMTLAPPRLLNAAMRDRRLTPYRHRTIDAARGMVLEIGVGSGLNLPLYGPAVVCIVALDPSLELLRLAHERISDALVPVSLLQASAEQLPFVDAIFDAVVMTWTLCSIPHPVVALTEMRRVLRPGGQLLFVEHGLSPERRVARWQHGLTPCWKRIGGGCHLDRKMDDLIRAAGFRVAAIETGYMTGSKPWTFMYQGSAMK